MIENLKNIGAVTLIRPHHLEILSVKEALVGWKNPREIAEEYIEGLLKVEDEDPAYFVDLFGRQIGNTYPDMGKVRSDLQSFFGHLRSLGDKDLVQFDLGLDGICKASIIGKHCLAGNYRDTRGPFSLQKAVDSEREKLAEIRKALVGKGNISGKDFIEIPTTHEMFDFKGREFGDSTPGTPLRVKLNSIIVSAGTLRAILNS